MYFFLQFFKMLDDHRNSKNDLNFIKPESRNSENNAKYIHSYANKTNASLLTLERDKLVLSLL